MAEREYQAERVAHQVQHAERIEVAVVARIPPGGAPVAALIRRHHVEAGGGERQHLMAPAEGELGETVQQQQQRAAGLLEPGFEPVHLQAIAVVGHAGAHPWRQRQRREILRHDHGAF